MRARLFMILISTAALQASQDASATVDFQLSDPPKTPTLESCHAWAASQHEQATLKMWGRIKNGKSSLHIAVLRLTLSCLGDDPPSIIFFGSSAGFNDRFCTDKRAEPICKQWAAIASMDPKRVGETTSIPEVRNAAPSSLDCSQWWPVSPERAFLYKKNCRKN